MAFWNKKKKTPQELMANGDFKRAIAGFRDLLKDKKEPDPVIMMQLGGALQKAGQLNDAKEVFVQVGTFYGDQGFFNKSVAAFKKALNITPDDSEILEKLSSYNDKVPKFMIDTNILARLKQEALSHNTGVHQVITAADLEEDANTASQESIKECEPPPSDHIDEPQVSSMNVGQPEELDLPLTEITDELNREEVLASAIKASGMQEPQKTPVEFQHDVDNTYEEILDLSEINFEEDPKLEPASQSFELEEEFPMNFGDDQGSVPLAQPPEPPAPVPRNPPQEVADQLTEGGMVFKSQKESTKNRSMASNVFDSLDDALDNMFSDKGLFEAAPDDVPEDDSVELTLADISAEENAKHWPLFRTMPPDAFLALVIALETRDYEIGELIVEEGQSGDQMYLVAEGEVEVIVTIGGVPTAVAILTEGDFFGEASLLSNAPRNATVRSLTATNCLLLSRAHLNKLVVEHPSVMASIESIYYTRIKENASRRTEARS